MNYLHQNFNNSSNIDQTIPTYIPNIFEDSLINLVESHCKLSPPQQDSGLFYIDKDGKEHIPPSKNMNRKSFPLSNSPDLNPFLQKLNSIIPRANFKYNFDLDFYEFISFFEYPGDGTLLEWHNDISGGKCNKRKLSFVIFCNDPNEYEGGTLEIANDHFEPFIVPKDKGGVVFFPSFLLHRVTPTTRGVRKVIAGFLGGRPYR